MSAAVKMNKKLNFVIPVDTAVGEILVHSMPISREVFERYYMEIGKTFAEIYTAGLGITAGPRVAKLVLKKISEDLGTWDGPAGVENGLLNEIRRLSNAIVPSDKGWSVIPLHEAIEKGVIDADDATEVENALTFFTVASSMHKRQDARGILEGAGKLWGARVESLSCTELKDSFQTSTAPRSTAETPKPSAIPS
jgi:hypothetical protein